MGGLEDWLVLERKDVGARGGEGGDNNVYVAKQFHQPGKRSGGLPFQVAPGLLDGIYAGEEPPRPFAAV